jgi:hypothetical protein
MGETAIIIPFSLLATLLAIGWWRVVSGERDQSIPLRRESATDAPASGGVEVESLSEV